MFDRLTKIPKVMFPQRNKRLTQLLKGTLLPKVLQKIQILRLFRACIYINVSVTATVLKTEAGSLPEGKVKVRLEHDGTLLDVDEDDVEKVRPQPTIVFSLHRAGESLPLRLSGLGRLHIVHVCEKKRNNIHTSEYRARSSNEYTAQRVRAITKTKNESNPQILLTNNHVITQAVCALQYNI